MASPTISLNSIAQSIWELWRKEIYDNDELDIREIKYWIIAQRALWLKNNLSKGNGIDDSIKQSLGCVDVDLYDASGCCTDLAGCKILRTVLSIPKTIDSVNLNTLTKVAPINVISTPFMLVDDYVINFIGNGRFNKNAIYAFLNGGYIWLYSKNMKHAEYLGIKKINIEGVFENPTEVSAFTNCDGQPCYTDDDPFPCPAWMIEYIIGEINKNKFNINMATEKMPDKDDLPTNTITK